MNKNWILFCCRRNKYCYDGNRGANPSSMTWMMKVGMYEGAFFVCKAMLDEEVYKKFCSND